MDLKRKNNGGTTALMLVCANYSQTNLIDVVRFLIDSGIDLNCTSKDGSNALLYLCANNVQDNLIDIIKLLIDSGIDVNCRNSEGFNAFRLLCQCYTKSNLIELFQLLIDNKIEVDLNFVSKHGSDVSSMIRKNYSDEQFLKDVFTFILLQKSRKALS